MGRVFTIMFEFQEEQHIGMVTVYDTPTEGTPFYVQLFNAQLYHLIPEGKFMFTLTERQLPASIQGPLAIALFQSVKAAIDKHINTQPTTVHEEMINEGKHDSNTDTRL